MIKSIPNNNHPITTTTTHHPKSPSTPTTTTSLSLSSTTPEDSSPSPQQQNNNKPNPLILAARALLTRLTFLKASFARLSKKGKLFLGVPLVAILLFLGSAVRGSTTGRTATASNKPVEVPFSVFMDLAEGERNKEAAVRVKKMLTRVAEARNDKKKAASPAGRLLPPSSLSLENVVIGKERISFRTTSREDGDNPAWNRDAFTRKVYATPDLLQFLRTNDIAFRAASTKSQNAMTGLVRFVFFGAYLLFLIRMYQNVSGGGGAGGNTPGKLASQGGERPLVKFEDIEGIDKAKFEVMELVDTLRNPQKYAILGARAPKGLLLVGPPGTGKTMLARATAATAGVPLLYCSGSDFVEMFVGRGAARVRKTFSRAAKLAPCIIFIDELDALGKSRETPFGNMKLSSNDEAEQTLNQLLACMDGLDSAQGVCVLAATNRREVLDPALTRPGRFDRIVTVELPDVAGREKILRLYAGRLPGFTEGRGVDETRMGSLGRGAAVDLSAVASVTPGLSGAELDVIVNEAAIRAVRRVGRVLREGGSGETMVRPCVMAVDFEESVAHFYGTRGGKGGMVGGGMGKLFENVLGNK